MGQPSFRDMDPYAQLPCPFCDENLMLYLEWLDHAREYAVTCHACGAHRPISIDARYAKQRWNTRDMLVIDESPERAGDASDALLAEP
jgi:hypothetical protein